jgi:hypothetical protein
MKRGSESNLAKKATELQEGTALNSLAPEVIGRKGLQIALNESVLSLFLCDK